MAQYRFGGDQPGKPTIHASSSLCALLARDVRRSEASVGGMSTARSGGRTHTAPPERALLGTGRVVGRRLAAVGIRAIVKGALLVVPGGAFVGPDDAVVIGVDLVKAFAEPSVTLGRRHRGKEVVIGFLPFESRLALRVQILFR